ncbi:MAG: ABC transporter permease [Chlorobi bacterium]|nr:ABC transporter permease [Chlorobiota bacterium]
MSWLDMILMGFGNMARSRLRTMLTVLGVVVGIGALSSMVSFGTGMQKNVTDAFYENDLFTSMNVTSKKVDIDRIMSGDISAGRELLSGEGVPLTDSIIDVIKKMDGVELVIPDISFPVRLKFHGKETNTMIQVMPEEVFGFKPYNAFIAGKSYADRDEGALVIREEILRNLGIIIEGERKSNHTVSGDSLGTLRLLPPDSVVGQQAEIVSVVLDPSKIRLNIFNPQEMVSGDPVSERTTPFRISGVLKKENEFSINRFRGGIMVSPRAAERIPRIGFSSVWDFLSADNRKSQYTSLYVRVKQMEDMDKVRKQIEEMGLGVFSLADKLDEFKSNFVIINSLLGAVGFIALFVAALGIINTMVMSIMERTREIGIMKAIGASDREIRWIFFTEAGTIGFIGGIFGLLLGYGVTRIANLILNTKIRPMDLEPVDMFYFPGWLLFGSLLFAILVSLAAGLYPASRAARVDPVKALRHD